MNLKDASTEDLLAELRRRNHGTRERHPGCRQYCEDCSHFVTWDGPAAADPPKDYNPCAKGHEMLFHAPTSPDPYGWEWGFFRQNCLDRDVEDTEE